MACLLVVSGSRSSFSGLKKASVGTYIPGRKPLLVEEDSDAIDADDDEEEEDWSSLNVLTATCG